jgi:hypothetical protein
MSACFPSGGVGGAVTYNWISPTQGTIAQTGTQTTTYTPPAPWSTYTQTDIAPSISICESGGAGYSCRSYATSLILIPTFWASGEVYIDENKNGQLDGTDQPYKNAAALTICQGSQPGGCSSSSYETVKTNPTDGTFTTKNTLPLIPGQYTALLTVPSGYQVISPKPPVAVFTVGNSSTGTTCVATAPASCDTNGNVLSLDFGISNASPWMQAIGGDITGNFISDANGGGFTDAIPSTADPSCSGGAYALASGAGGTHGLINTGSGGANFGQGQEAAAQNWLVGGNAGNYPYTYTMPLSNQAKTAYANLSYEIKQSDVQTTPLNNIPNWTGCNDLSNCTLPGNGDTDTTAFPSGVYTVGDTNTADLTLKSASGTYTFPVGGQYVILVNGILNINTKIIVPNGSFVLFSTANDINVASGVGDSYNSTASDLDGYYSTDKSFNVLGQGTNGSAADCGTTTGDLRLNVTGSIVVNSVTTNGGGFYYNRDLCSNDQFCPVFTITERPDFLLNAPSFLMFPRRIWQEVAP